MIKLQKYAKRIIIFTLALMLGGLFLWRMLPRTFEDAAGMKAKNPDSTPEHVQFWQYAAAEVYANGAFYELKVGNGEELQAVWDILSAVKYRPSFRNLLPGYKNVPYQDPNVNMMFFDDTATISLNLDFYQPQAVMIDGKIYYPVDLGMQEALINYITAHGRER